MIELLRRCESGGVKPAGLRRSSPRSEPILIPPDALATPQPVPRNPLTVSGSALAHPGAASRPVRRGRFAAEPRARPAPRATSSPGPGRARCMFMDPEIEMVESDELPGDLSGHG